MWLIAIQIQGRWTFPLIQKRPHTEKHCSGLLKLFPMSHFLSQRFPFYWTQRRFRWCRRPITYSPEAQKKTNLSEPSYLVFQTQCTRVLTWDVQVQNCAVSVFIPSNNFVCFSTSAKFLLTCTRNFHNKSTIICKTLIIMPVAVKAYLHN